MALGHIGRTVIWAPKGAPPETWLTGVIWAVRGDRAKIKVDDGTELTVEIENIEVEGPE
jgi:hypothetical protein